MTKDEIINCVENLCNKAMEEGYNQGLCDAWECARKIYHMSFDDAAEVFPDSKGDIFDDNSAFEAMAKIKEYEKNNHPIDRVKIGDEVIYQNEKWIITAIANSGHTVMLLSSSGGYMARTEPERVKKTNKNFLPIAEIFKGVGR